MVTEETIDETIETFSMGDVTQKVAVELILAALIEGGHHKQYHIEEALTLILGKQELARIKAQAEIDGYYWGKAIVP